jgi:tetratricopeptide (TPR) repeat protein
MELKKKIIYIIVCIVVIAFYIDMTNGNKASETMSDNYQLKNLVNEWNETGLTLVDEGKIEQGIDYFQQALQKAEEYEEVGTSSELEKGTLLSNSYNNLGLAYYLLDKYNESKNYLEMALDIEPNDAIEHSNMGNTYIALDQSEEAMKQFDLSLGYDSDLSYALYGKGTIYYDQNEYEKALSFFNLYLDQIPDDKDAINYSIYCNLSLNNFDKALALADKAIASFEDDYEFYVAKGDIYAKTKNYEELKQFYNNLASKFNYDVNAQIMLGEFYYNNEEYPAALEQFQKANNQFKDNSELDSWLVSSYAALDDFKGLSDYYHNIADSSKVTEQLCIDIGNAFYDSTYYMESIPYFEDAIKINPDSEEACIDKLRSLYYGKRYNRGIEFGMEIEQKFYTNLDIPAYIGDCYYNLGDYENAISAFKRALELSPDNTDLLAYIGESYLYLDDLQNATTYTEDSLKIDSTHQYAQETRTLIKDKQKDLNVQIKELIKENYLYYTADAKSDKLINKQFNQDSMSNSSIAAAIDTIRKPDDMFTFTIFDEYYDEYYTDATDSVEYEQYGDISYLRISSFDLDTDSQVIEILDSITDPETKVLAIDLRGNGGGLIQGATNILDVLLGDCVSCTLVYRDGYTYNYYSDASQIKFKKVYLFVDEYSASSSELLTLSLKTYLNNVTVVGQNTFGKGVGQTTYDDKDRKLEILLVNFYWNVRQKNIMGTNIAPDIYVNSDKLEDYLEVIN